MATLDTTTLTGSKALDAAIKACSSFGGTQAVIDQLLADQKKAGSGDKFLKDYCGINLDNADTGAITGKDAGGSAIKTAQSIVPENTKISLDTSFNGTSFTVAKYGVTFNLNGSFDDLSDDAQYAWRAMKTWWAEGVLDLNKESYGYSYNDGKDPNLEKNILITFINSGADYSMMTHWYPVTVNKVKMREIKINMAQWKNLQHDMDGTNSRTDGNTAYMDRDLAHELTHALMFGKIKEFVKIPSIIREGVAEITHGRDDYKTNDIKTLADSASLLEKVFKESSFYATSSDGVAKVVESPAYVAGYIFMRYLTKQAAENFPVVEIIENNVKNKTVNGTSGNDTIKNIAGGAKIYAGAGDDSIYNSVEKNYTINSSGGNVTIDGGAGNDFIESNDPNVSIFGGTGNDTVHVIDSPRNVTVRGGDGNDSIDSSGVEARIYGDNGDDFIRNTSSGTSATIYGGTGNDIIINSGKSSKLFGEAGSDVILDFHDEVTISGGLGNDIISLASNANNVVIDYGAGDGNDWIYGLTAEDTLRITGATTATTIASGNHLVVNVNGSNVITIDGGKGKSFKIEGLKQGTSVNDKLVSLSSGNDKYQNTVSGATIYGNAGNDSLGNSAADSVTMSGGAGNDTITNKWNSGGNHVSMSGDAGNDYIYDDYGWYNTLNGGADNDILITYRGKYNWIFGGAGNDKLFGEAGNDTLAGGAGNDTLEGGAGNDVFVYGNGEGKDVIADYAAGDKIKITSGTISKTTYSGSDVVFTVGSGSVTVKDGKGKKITIVDASGKSTTQTYSGAVTGTSKLFVDDNFISDDNNLDAISKISADNYSVGKISATNFETLAQDEIYIASAKK